jgi:hypothetical protein
MADTLSLRYVLSSTLTTRMLGFEYVKKLYMNDDDFANVLMHIIIQLLKNI